MRINIKYKEALIAIENININASNYYNIKQNKSSNKKNEKSNYKKQDIAIIIDNSASISKILNKK